MDILTVSGVITAFGGTGATARIFGVGDSAVSNWKAFDHFPDRLHYRIAREAKIRGINISEKLFDTPTPTPGGDRAVLQKAG